MKRLLLTLLLAATAVSPGFAQSETGSSSKATREVLDDRVREVNRSGKQQGMNLSLERISTETGVPLEDVKAMHRKHSDIGVADLMIACVLANETKKEPETFLKQRASGKSWTALARENNVPVDKLNARLDRLDSAIGDKPKREKKSD